MTIKRLLIFAPLVLIVILLQSYFWVPTYEQETRGNPDRLSTYITASTGDASLLNPILSADSASSEIESHVFEGLIDRDQNLRYRGRVASGWELYEEAYFYVNPQMPPSGTDTTDPQAVAELIRSARASNAAIDPKLKATLERITDITVLPPRRFTVTRKAVDATTTSPAADIQFRVDAPARIKLRLSQVDQNLFDHMQSLRHPAAHGTESGYRFSSPHGCPISRRPSGGGRRCALHLRRHHEPAKPFSTYQRLRTGQNGGGHRSAHRQNRLQAALLTGHRYLADGHSARTSAQPRGLAEGGSCARS
jgi:hypothetical protein